MASSDDNEMEVQPQTANEGTELEIDEYAACFEQLEEIDSKSIEAFKNLLENERVDDKAIKIKEQCIYKLAKLYTESKSFNDVMELLKSSNAYFTIIPKARTAKIVRNILNIVATVPDSLDIQVTLCKDVVQWCVAEKRTFLKQRIEAKLASLLLQQKQPVQALSLIDDLLADLRKLDDKQMLTETHLTEARIYHSLQNIPKSKASLTASRTAANSIYVVPVLQAEIDEMSGTLHCEESDYTTAYSYFLEAFDAYDQNKHPSAIACLKYMILCKILNESSADVPALLSSKFGMKHAGIDLEAMSAIAKAAKIRSLEDFQAAVAKYEQYLKSDDLISHHLDLLYDKMLEANLLKIVHPFSCVEIAHVAKLINLPENTVVHKLSQMILDQKFSGILDQGRGHLIIYDQVEGDTNFTRATEIVGHMGSVVETLIGRAKGLIKTNA